MSNEKLERKPFKHDDDDVADVCDNADDSVANADDDVIADVGAFYANATWRGNFQAT